MKRKLIIDVDSDRKQAVIIGPIKTYTNETVIPNPILDMGVLCEALVTMIHLCHQEGIKKDSDSIRDCIDHLKKGFAESGYKGYLSDEARKNYKEKAS